VLDNLIVYEGVGATLEEALRVAHAKVPPPGPGKDYNTSRVVESGVQFGGITGQTVFWVRLIEEPYSEFKT
jgi:hypothetical protein